MTKHQQHAHALPMRSCLLPLLPAILLVDAFIPCCQAQEGARFSLQHHRIAEFRSSDAAAGECQLEFVLTGDGLENALDAGQWIIEQAVDDTGTALTLLPGAETGSTYRPLKKRHTATEPVAILKLALTPSSRAARSIKTLKGSVGVNVYRRQVVIIEDLHQNKNKLIENPLFDAHGFTVQVIEPQHAYPGYSSSAEQTSLLNRAIALRIEGDIDKVDSITLATSDGTLIPARPAGFGAGRSRIMALMADAPLPENITAQLLIPIDPQEIRIPFSFSDLVLP